MHIYILFVFGEYKQEIKNKTRQFQKAIGLSLYKIKNGPKLRLKPGCNSY